MRILSDNKYINPIPFETKRIIHANLETESVQYGITNAKNSYTLQFVQCYNYYMYSVSVIMDRLVQEPLNFSNVIFNY